MQLRAFSLAALACLAVSACGERGQQLPFETPTADPVVKTVPDAGGTVSTPAGASVQLPAGAVAGGTTVTLSPVAAQASSASGTAAAQNAFKLDPAGLQLTTPADVDLSLNRAQAAWMASVVVSTPGGVIEDGQGSVDLATGLLRGSISKLGTVSAVIPEPAAVLRAGPLSAATAAVEPVFTPRTAVAVPTKSLRGDCGAPGKRCDGLVVEVSASLLDLVDSAVVIYPRMEGEIRITGATAAGALTLVAPLRVRLSSRANATTVPSRITAAATAATVVTETAGRITLSNLKVVGESGSSRGETTATLVIEYQGTRAFIRLGHSFLATVAGGTRENVTVAARIPLLRVE
jgi:hypothetical protein